MSEHKGMASYIHNPGVVDSASGAPKDLKSTAAPTPVPVYGLENTQHKHSGPETYAHNPGAVDAAAKAPPMKDEHAPDPAFKRRPVVPLPAIPTENGRAVYGLDLGERTQMSQESLGSKGLLESPLPEVKDII
jgi:hypothetical protein